jgi:hypothetical protein
MRLRAASLGVGFSAPAGSVDRGRRGARPFRFFRDDFLDAGFTAGLAGAFWVAFSTLAAGALLGSAAGAGVDGWALGAELSAGFDFESALDALALSA